MAGLYGLIGYPLQHSYSALMHNAAFKELGIDCDYQLFEIKPEELEDQFEKLITLGVSGFNITVPYKERIISSLDQLTSEADLIGAVNTVKIDKTVRKQGLNTDGPGFMHHLSQVIGFNPQGKRTAVLGAGGAAKAICVQLAQNKAASIGLFDIDQFKARELANRLQANFSDCQISLVDQANALLQDSPQLLVNATPLGMHKNDPVVFDSRLLHHKLLVYDLVYNPQRTPLLAAAQRQGCAGVFNGLGMLLYQGVLAFKIWLGIDPPVEIMEQALRDALSAA